MSATTTTIHDLESAAKLARVTPKVVRRWIGEGLRATPVGRVGKRGPSDWRILETWIFDFLEKNARTAGPGSPRVAARSNRRARPAGKADPDDPLGPCPK